MIINKQIEIKTQKQFELVDITQLINAEVTSSNVKDGLVSIFCPHTTAAIRLNHNEPLLIQDIMHMIYRLVPIDQNYNHDLFELRSGVDVNERTNGHAHVKAFLLGSSSESVPIKDGKLILGDRQSVFFVELDGGRDRNFNITIIGE